MEEAGLTVWCDTRLEPGQHFSSEIGEALYQARQVLVLWSYSSTRSDWVLGEADLALKLKKYVPVRLDNCDLPLPFSGYHTPKLDLSDNCRDHLLALLNAVVSPSGTISIGRAEVQLARLPSSSSILFGRSTELRMLNAAWESNLANVFVLAAVGGAGKTALINYWIDQMRNHGWRGAQKVYGWSFYSQGTTEDRQQSADLFLVRSPGSAIAVNQSRHPGSAG